MPRRAAATASVRKQENPPPPPNVEEDEEQEPEPRSRDIEEYLKTLDRDVIRQSLVYVYRLDPKIKSLGKNKYIAKYSGDAFSTNIVEEEYGGGKYKFFLDAHDQDLNAEFFHDGPAELPPKINRIHYVMMDDEGNAMPWPAPGAVSAAPGSGKPGDPEGVIREATAAARVGNEAAQSALTASVNLISQGAAKALEIVANATKDQTSGSSEVAALRKEISDLATSLHNREKEDLQRQIAELRQAIQNGPARGSGELGSLSETAKVLGVEGGAVGVIKAIAGGAAKEEGMLDYIGKGLGEGLKTFLVEQGGNVVQAWREHIHVRAVKASQRKAATPAPAAPAPVARPAPQPANPSLAGEQPADEPIEQETIVDLVTQITKTIRYYMVRNFDGASVAEIVKDKFQPYMRFIGAIDIFKDFNKLIEFCRQNPDLQEFIETNDQDTKEAFLVFAREFWNEFQPEPPAESSTAPAQVN
jgi:hypothetical protein